MFQERHKQSAHWLDNLVTAIVEWAQTTDQNGLHVDDMKTPSGRVHVGALRGVILHDLVAKALAATNHSKVVSTYVFNDMDPMDALPSYLDPATYSNQMGKPLFMIPPPPLNQSGIDFSNSTQQERDRYQKLSNFAEFYAEDFRDAFLRLGCHQQIIWSHQLYQSGQMNSLIKLVLDHADQVRAIYQEVANYQLPLDWLPFQVICPKCGKIGTTTASDWDGETVAYHCQPNKVSWAKGCDHQGRTSPFDGTGKLLWKVDWPAHWRCLGVNIEGAGKDHTSAGGSRDMANQLMKKVFQAQEPFDVPYEWILIRGAKMSSSKGVGVSAREFMMLFPPAVGRFLFASRHFNTVIDFDPATMAVPDLFDQYDQAARIFWQLEKGDERVARSFELSQISAVDSAYFLPRFRDVVTWMQDPKISIEAKFAEVKGQPLTSKELTELAERERCAQIWLDRYAPEKFRLHLADNQTMPTFNQLQQQFLIDLEQLIESQTWQPENLQQAIYELAKASVGAKVGFQTIYQLFLGKDFGPKAAWFLLDLPTQKRKEMIKTATQAI